MAPNFPILQPSLLPIPAPWASSCLFFLFLFLSKLFEQARHSPRTLALPVISINLGILCILLVGRATVQCSTAITPNRTSCYLIFGLVWSQPAWKCTAHTAARRAVCCLLCSLLRASCRLSFINSILKSFDRAKDDHPAQHDALLPLLTSSA